jgi:hypothetical protein
MFGLISRNKLINNMEKLVKDLEKNKNIVKSQYDNKEIKEWSYYKILWTIRGKIQLLNDLITSLG